MHLRDDRLAQVPDGQQSAQRVFETGRVVWSAQTVGWGTVGARRGCQVVARAESAALTANDDDAHVAVRLGLLERGHELPPGAER